MTDAATAAFEADMKKRGPKPSQYDRATTATIRAIERWAATSGAEEATPEHMVATFRAILADAIGWRDQHGGSSAFLGRPSIASYALHYAERAAAEALRVARFKSTQAVRAARQAKVQAIVAEAKDVRTALGLTGDEMAAILNVGGRPANSSRLRNFEAKSLTPEESQKWLDAYKAVAKLRGVGGER